MIDLLGRLNAGLARLCVFAASVLIGAMTIVVIVGVWYRYVLNNSIGWTEEVAILSAIWVAFLVAPAAYRMGGHVAIEMIPAALPQALGRILRMALNLIVLWLLYRFFMEAIVYVQRGSFVRANTLPVQLSWFRGVMPASILMMALVGVELILRDLAVLVTRNPHHDIARVHAEMNAQLHDQG